MKIMKIIFFFSFLIILALTQNILLGQRTRVELFEDINFQKNYTLSITQADLKKFNQEAFAKWFLFVDLQPINNVTWIQTYVDLYIQKQNGQPFHKKGCIRFGSELQTCYLTSQDFDFKKDKIIVTVASDQECNITLKSQISSLYKLDLNVCIQLDYQKEAFSKLFEINLENLVDFKQIRVLLTPINQLYAGQPIQLYAGTQNYNPTPSTYSFGAFDIWDYGKGLIMDSVQITQASKIIILVDAPEHYIYNLQTQIILNFEAVNIKAGQKYHDVMEFNAMRQYHFKFENNKSKQNYIRIKNYFGTAYVLSFRAGKLAKNITQLSDLAMLINDQMLSEINYQVAEGITQITATVNSMSYVSTFTIEAYESKSSINQLFQGAARINQVANNQKTFYFARIIRFKQDNLGQSKARFQIRTQSGKNDQKLYFCKKDQIQNCKVQIQTYQTDGKQNPNIIQFPKLQKEQNQNQNIYILQIEENYFSDYDQKHKQIIVFVEIIGTDPLGSTVSIIFRNVGIMYSLSEQEIKTEKMKSGELNFYKFSVVNASGIDSIYFYYSIYYGMVDFFLTQENPVQKSQSQLTQFLKSSQPRRFHRFQNHLLVDKVQSNKPYYIIAVSFSQSYFMLNTQVVRNQKHRQDISLQNSSFSIIQISDVSDFKYLFQPSTLHLFEFKPKGQRYMILYRTSLPLQVCFQKIDNKAEYPIEPNCDRTKTIGKHSMSFMNSEMYKNIIGIKNFHNRSTEMSISLYSDWDKCQNQAMGQKMILQTQSLKQYNLTSACVYFKLYKKEEVLITAKLDNPLMKNNFYLELQIGQKQFVHLTNEENIISKEEIDQSCDGQYEYCYAKIVFTPLQQADSNQFYNERITLWMQYTDDPILLEDGISFTSTGTITKTSPRYFKYLLHELQEDITFVLQNKLSFYKAYLKLQYFQDRFVYPKPNDVGQQNFTYETNNQMLSIYQTTTIKSQILKNKCATKGQKYCVLLISVYPLNHDEIQDGKFRVELTQFVSQLFQHTPSIGYLQKNSLAFYEFENRKQGGTISIFANTNNEHCLSIYAKAGIKTKATISINDNNVKNGAQLIINDAKAQKYSITLQANKNCQYHLQVSTISTQFSIIKKGYSVDLDLKAGKQKYLLFQNQLKSSFRIMALFSSSSQILIKAFATRSDDQLQDFINSNNTDSFSDHSYDWEDRNSLRIDVNHSKFCENCYYIIKVQALRDVLGQLTIPSWDQQITIKSDSFIYDQLYKGQKSIYRAYTTSHIKFQLQLQSGKIIMKVIDKKDNRTLTQKTYSPSNALIEQKIVLQNDLSYEYFRYTYIQLYCIQNSHFVFSVSKGTKQEGEKPIDDPDNDKVLNFMHFGIPKQLNLKKDKTICVNGVMQQDPTFLISSNENLKDIKLQKKLTSNDKIIPITTKQVKSGMIIKFQTPKKQSQLTYQFCLTSSKPIKLTIIQSAYINYLLQNTQLTVDDNTNLTFMANGSTILQVGECSGRAVLSISKDFKSVHDIGSQIKQYRKSNNLIEFNFTGPVYVQTHMSNSKGLTTLTWRQKNQEKGIGMGYDYFYASNFKMIRTPSLDNYAIILEVSPLKKYQASSKLPFRVTKLSYQIFIGGDQSQLLSNLNCHFKGPILFLIGEPNRLESQQLLQISSQILKSLQKQYKDFPYILITVVAKINVQTTYGNEQTYRFSYPYHQLAFNQSQYPVNDQQPKVIIIHQQLGNFMIIFLLICIITVGIFFAYRYYITKKRRNILLNREAINTMVQAEMVDGMTINDE